MDVVAAATRNTNAHKKPKAIGLRLLIDLPNGLNSLDYLTLTFRSRYDA